MGTKRNPGTHDCYKNALPDEPMFVLLARDPAAPGRVEDWADYREMGIAEGRYPKSDENMVQEARECAAAMRRWRTDNFGKWKGVVDERDDKSGGGLQT